MAYMYRTDVSHLGQIDDTLSISSFCVNKLARFIVRNYQWFGSLGMEVCSRYIWMASDGID